MPPAPQVLRTGCAANWAPTSLWKPAPKAPSTSWSTAAWSIQKPRRDASPMRTKSSRCCARP